MNVKEAIGKDVETTSLGDGLGSKVGSEGDPEVPRRAASLEVVWNRAAEVEDSALPAAFDVAA
jgi:hypothetical protein